MRSRILKKQVVLFSYYSPEELTGIGKYNGELIEYLLKKGVSLVSISNAPFYPYWKKYVNHKNPIYSSSVESFKDIRTWVYIPKNPGSLKKIISEISFLLSSALALFLNIRQLRSDALIIVINPPFFLGFLPFLLTRGSKSKLLVHIQDLQVDAARELNLLPKSICIFMEIVEKWFLRRVDYVSTISQGMINKIRDKNVDKPILYIPNWADLESIFPKGESVWLHKHLNIPISKKLVVYSGNIGEKQGLDNLVKAAKILEANNELHFVILGEGLYKNQLQRIINDFNLKNFTLGSLVQKEKINEMLNSSFLQVVIQKGQSTESFLPSKLTNILASGSACIVTANEETTLYKILKPTMAAVLIEADNSEKLAHNILHLYEDQSLRNRLKVNARSWAEDNLSIDMCLRPLEKIIAS